MSEWVSATLDLLLIGLVGVGLVQVMRLMRQLTDLRQSRMDMQKFVVDFNGTVMRAEAGIKNLRSAARESGDDLEKLTERATMVRDELTFIVESADQVATRLSQAATSSPTSKSSSTPAAKSAAPTGTAQTSSSEKTVEPMGQPPSSRAEKELLQALQKLK